MFDYFSLSNIVRKTSQFLDFLPSTKQGKMRGCVFSVNITIFLLPNNKYAARSLILVFVALLQQLVISVVLTPHTIHPQEKLISTTTTKAMWIVRSLHHAGSLPPAPRWNIQPWVDWVGTFHNIIYLKYYSIWQKSRMWVYYITWGVSLVLIGSLTSAGVY